MTATPRCFKIHAADNVATLLDDVEARRSLSINDGGSIVAGEPIKAGHKIALRDIPAGQQVVKYGVAIGIASQDIVTGEWVHLHNCRSAFDDGRSASLDLHTGSTTDTRYE